MKKTTKNKYRVEGSIWQAYLAQEISFFASHYFESHVLSKSNRVDHNDDLIKKCYSTNYLGLLSFSTKLWQVKGQY